MIFLREIKEKLIRSDYKQWEQSRIKKVKAEEAARFLTECRERNKIPKFLDAWDRSTATRKLNEEIDKQTRLVGELTSSINNLFYKFTLVFAADETASLSTFMDNLCSKLRRSVRSYKKL